MCRSAIVSRQSAVRADDGRELRGDRETVLDGGAASRRCRGSSAPLPRRLRGPHPPLSTDAHLPPPSTLLILSSPHLYSPLQLLSNIDLFPHFRILLSTPHLLQLNSLVSFRNHCCVHLTF